MKKSLVITDAQEGFAGLSGKIWTIEPSGSWHIARFLNEKTMEPHQTGHLSEEELKSVGKILASGNFLKLPAMFGRNVKINRHIITIAFGEKASTLILRPGESFAEAERETDGREAVIRKQFIKIVQTIQHLLEKNEK